MNTPTNAAMRPSDAQQAIYDKACAMDNQDVPLEEWPDKLIEALARAGYAVVPVSLPHELLGDAAIAGMAETGNPKHCWDYLVGKSRVYSQRAHGYSREPEQRETLDAAQPAQAGEAVARVEKHTGDLRDMAIIVWLRPQPPEGTLLYLHPQPEQPASAAEKERDFLVEEYERATKCGKQGYLHCAQHLFNAITNPTIDAYIKWRETRSEPSPPFRRLASLL